MSKAPSEPDTKRASVRRVDAPPTQPKPMKRLPPSFALAWLHLLPDSAFPIHSRDDLAVKISTLLLGGTGPEKVGRTSLPIGAAPKPSKADAAP